MATIKPLETDDPSASANCRLVVVGSAIEALVRGDGGFGNYADIVAFHPNLDAWPAEDTTPADLVVIGCPTLFPETIALIQERLGQSGAGRAVVVYEFAKADTESATKEPANNITSLRAPVTAGELHAACEADIAISAMRDQWALDGESLQADVVEEVITDLVAEVPARQFADSQLAAMSRISTAIDCECPHHLASLLNTLNAFEDYCESCENRNEEDALLHGYLHRTTAKARSMMEEALVVLAEAEGIEVE